MRRSVTADLGTMKLALAALVTVCVLSSAGGMSTCKTLDLELVKKKRIEAIRGQILSKLRLPKEPEAEQAGEGEAIPATLLSLYNSTEEMLKEEEEAPPPVSVQQEEEEYFAKELHKFTMKRSELEPDTRRAMTSRATTLYPTTLVKHVTHRTVQPGLTPYRAHAHECY